MLGAAGLAFETTPAHVDEEALAVSLLATGQTPRNIADALAEAKAIKVSSRLPGITVLGADSTLALADGTMLSKPKSPEGSVAKIGGSQRRSEEHTSELQSLM